MKQITQSYKTNIKELGRQFDSTILFNDNGTWVYLKNEDIISVTPHYEGGILKSVMKQLDIECYREIEVGNYLQYQLGVLIDNYYEYIDFGTYFVYSCEKQEDTGTYKIICYDLMLKTMVDYESLNIEYPITIRDYITAICTHLGLGFLNYDETFVNYDKEIPDELYLDENGNSLNYTFRDVLDELAQVTASTICIGDRYDELGLEIRYIPKGTISKNILDMSEGFRNGYINTSGNFVSQNQTAVFNQNIEVEAGQTYCFSTNASVDNLVVSMFQSNNTYKTRTKVTNTDRIVQLIPSDVAYVKFSINKDNSVTMTQNILNSLQPMVEKNNTRTDYEPHILVDTINEEYLKDINVNFGEKFGPVNTISFKRSADSDVISLSEPSDLADEDKIEIAITDNQILNGSNRADFIEEILEQLYGLEYYLCDYTSTGITYYELCDRYNVQIGDTTYNCVMFNDEINITQGLEEHIFADRVEESKTDYTTTTKDDRTMLRTELIVNKVNGQITGVVESQNNLESKVSKAEATLTEQGATLEVITKNIDTTTGDITALKRTSYELGENGLIIDDEQGYKSVSNTTGQYYYDGDMMVGKYTKDGSVQKDMALFGKYYYGIDEDLDVENFTKDDAMFMAQLYEDNNGNEAFGHFYNG